MNTEIIFTTQEQSWDLCLEELKSVPGFKLVKWLIPGVGIMELPGEFHEISRMIRQQTFPEGKSLYMGPIFLRHIFPLQAVTSAEDLSAVTETALRLFEGSKIGSFSVQVRILEESSHNKYDLTTHLSGEIQKTGRTLSVQSPYHVLSMVIRGGLTYMGLSEAAYNLSDWAGGMRRFAKYDGQISRAEFKLLEAVEMFGGDFPTGGRALDLGAAPGGWTKVLLDTGLDVVAVDPGELSNDIKHRNGLTHYIGLAQEYLTGAGGVPQFDLIVNDMRMDIPDSVRIMTDAAELLSPGGTMIMTFKLSRVHGKIFRTIHSGLAGLSRKYHITHAKQLFHNRSEITVTGVRA